MAEEVLFEDGYIKLTKTELILYCFWFPFGFSKRIPLSSITKIDAYYPRSIFQMKNWGMATDFQVWWYSDMQRGFHALRGTGGNAIVVSTGSCPFAGLTPSHGAKEAVQQVAQKLRELCPSATFAEH